MKWLKIISKIQAVYSEQQLLKTSTDNTSFVYWSQVNHPILGPSIYAKDRSVHVKNRSASDKDRSASAKDRSASVSIRQGQVCLSWYFFPTINNVYFYSQNSLSLVTFFMLFVL